MYMGVRRLFSRGGQNFPGGPGTINMLKMPKTYNFFKKVENILFLSAKGGRGGGGQLALPADAHLKVARISNQYVTTSLIIIDQGWSKCGPSTYILIFAAFRPLVILKMLLQLNFRPFIFRKSAKM